MAHVAYISLNDGGYCTVPVTPFIAPGTNSSAIHAAPPKGEDNDPASFAENPNRG